MVGLHDFSDRLLGLRRGEKYCFYDFMVSLAATEVLQELDECIINKKVKNQNCV